MAFIGIAFSIGFLIGPLVGAAFAVWAKGMYVFQVQSLKKIPVRFALYGVKKRLFLKDLAVCK